MKKNVLKALLIESLHLDDLYISGDSNHFRIIAISSKFVGMSRLKKQQMIYGPLIKHIINKDIHALSIETYTPEEWKDIMN